jgi:hypothetical protein
LGRRFRFRRREQRDVFYEFSRQDILNPVFGIGDDQQGFANIGAANTHHPQEH